MRRLTAHQHFWPLPYQKTRHGPLTGRKCPLMRHINVCLHPISAWTGQIHCETWQTINRTQETRYGFARITINTKQVTRDRLQTTMDTEHRTSNTEQATRNKHHDTEHATQHKQHETRITEQGTRHKQPVTGNTQQNTEQEAGHKKQ
jgi:hypothetical protein